MTQWLVDCLAAVWP